MTAQSFDPELAKKERSWKRVGRCWHVYLFVTRARWMGVGVENFNEAGRRPDGRRWRRWNVRLNFGCGSFQVMRFPRP